VPGSSPALPLLPLTQGMPLCHQSSCHLLCYLGPIDGMPGFVGEVAEVRRGPAHHKPDGLAAPPAHLQKTRRPNKKGEKKGGQRGGPCKRVIIALHLAQTGKASMGLRGKKWGKIFFFFFFFATVAGLTFCQLDSKLVSW